MLFISANLYAKDINERYSYADFMHQNFRDADPREFNDTTIVGSCFYQEVVYSPDSLGNTPPESLVEIFPDGTQDITFQRCNLDNVKLPKNIILINCANKRIRVMNDWDDWILDRDSKPVEPMNKEQRERANLSTSPHDIPDHYWTEEERRAFEELLNAALTP